MASTSPRRRELLGHLGVPFEIVAPEVEEYIFAECEGISPRELAEKNAVLKASAVARARPGWLVIGSDTVIALGNRVFGKPAHLDEAAEFLRALSGATHEVITGMCLSVEGGVDEVWSESTEVTFHPLSSEVISRYLGVVPVLDKAGGYALQQHGHWLVEKVVGSPSNVVGLPLESLAERLRQARFLVPGDPSSWRPA